MPSPARVTCRVPTCIGLLVAAWALSAAASAAQAQGFPPDEAPQHMTLADGLEATLVAAEPLVRQPVAIEFDDRGRLWVIQYLQYPNPAGLTRVKVDRYSRTQYDRVPEPPPHGPRGADRITILEDADGDGRMDRGRDFIEGLNLASGLAFGHGGVFVLNVPYLLFYPDRDRDDVPDGDPQVLLEGFGMEDAHSVANSLTWGPDGWLYGCQGSTVTARIRDIEFQQGVWRYHPITQQFELFCEGGGNSWGLDFDPRGNLFYSTNYGGYVLLHGVQGAYYTKNFGKHGALHNPHAYGYFEHAPHQNFQGGHVTVGGIVYHADLLPQPYRGTYIAADLLGHAVYWHTIEPAGSTFRTAHGGTLLAAGDTWFAPSDVTVGPEGAIYVADWHDSRMAHPDPDAEWDRSNGRIYRIAPAGTPPWRPGELDFTHRSSAELVAALGHRSQWHARRARMELAARHDESVWPPLRQAAAGATDESAALAALWTLAAGGGCNELTALQLLDSPHAAVRCWAVRLLGDSRSISDDTASRLDRLAEQEPDVSVRSQLAATAARLAPEYALPIIHSLLLRDLDQADPHLPLLQWWAVERHAVTDRDGVLRRFTAPTAWRSQLSCQTILPRLVRRYAAEGMAEGLAACARLLVSAPAGADGSDLFIALDQGLQEIGFAPHGPGAGELFIELDSRVDVAEGSADSSRLEIPADLLALAMQRWEQHRDDAAALRLACRLGHRAATEQALASIAAAETPVERRRDAIAVLAELGELGAVAPLLELVAGNEVPAELRSAALAALGRYDDARIAPALLAAYPLLDEAARGQARDVLLARRESCQALLEAVERGEVAAADVPLDQVRRVALHRDEALDALVRRHWGSVREGTREERLAEMRRLSNDLRAAPGDPAAGQAVYRKHCATCHRLFEEGNRVGPDLTTANRQDRDYLLVSLVDPSVVVRKEYTNYVVQTDDGRVLTGLLVEQTPASITLLDAKNQRHTVSAAEIEALEESAVSLMPEDLYRQLQPQELRDLFAYLHAAGP
jgi:putative membrane-bound dehydrogenase-like protein